RTMTVTSATACHSVRLIRKVAVFATVPSQFTRDCALSKTKQQGNLRLVVSFFDQYVYLVSLFAGKLSIAHRCASLTWRLKSTLTLQQLAFSPLSQSCTSNLKPPFFISHLLQHRTQIYSVGLGGISK